MHIEEFPNYIEEIKELRKKYKDKIEVKISTEVGFNTPGRSLDGQKKVLEPFIDEDIDYLLAGVHDIKWHESPIFVLDAKKNSEILNKYEDEELGEEEEKLIMLNFMLREEKMLREEEEKKEILSVKNILRWLLC